MALARAAAPPGAGGLARAVHQLGEALVVHRQALLGEQLLGQLVGEAVGVVQLEGVLGRDPGGLILLRAGDHVLEQALTLNERTAEVLLLRRRPLEDRVALVVQLLVGPAHDLDHALAQPRQERALDAEHAALLDRAAHDAAQHVAALLVRRHHAVRHQERHAATVVGEDPQRAGGGLVLAVAAPRQLLPELDQRPEVVGLVDRRHVLQDRRHAVEPETGVDVLLGQLGQRAVLVQVVLHEHEVPELEEALRVVARQVLLPAEVEAAVEVELRAGAAGAGRPELPEVVLATEQHDALVRDPDRAPALDRLVVGPEPELLVAAEHRDPDLLRREAEALRGELLRVLDRALLEVVAEREVAEHLEEGQVAGRDAHVLDVHRAEDLLARGQPRVRRRLLAEEVGLERLHPGRGEQHGGIVDRWHERPRRHASMVALLEEGEEGLPDLGGLHGPSV